MMVKMQRINFSLSLSDPFTFTKNGIEFTRVLAFRDCEIYITERAKNLKTRKVKITNTYFSNVRDAEDAFRAIEEE